MAVGSQTSSFRRCPGTHGYQRDQSSGDRPLSLSRGPQSRPHLVGPGRSSVGWSGGGCLDRGGGCGNEPSPGDIVCPSAAEDRGPWSLQRKPPLMRGSSLTPEAQKSQQPRVQGKPDGGKDCTCLRPSPSANSSAHIYPSKKD